MYTYVHEHVLGLSNLFTTQFFLVFSLLKQKGRVGGGKGKREERGRREQIGKLKGGNYPNSVFLFQKKIFQTICRLNKREKQKGRLRHLAHCQLINKLRTQQEIKIDKKMDKYTHMYLYIYIYIYINIYIQIHMCVFVGPIFLSIFISC